MNFICPCLGNFNEFHDFIIPTDLFGFFSEGWLKHQAVYKCDFPLRGLAHQTDFFHEVRWSPTIRLADVAASRVPSELGPGQPARWILRCLSHEFLQLFVQRFVWTIPGVFWSMKISLWSSCRMKITMEFGGTPGPIDQRHMGKPSYGPPIHLNSQRHLARAPKSMTVGDPMGLYKHHK